MSKYGNRTRRVIITMSSVAILSAVMAEPVMKADSTDEQLQSNQAQVSAPNENADSTFEEEGTLTIQPIYENSTTISGTTIYPNQIIQIVNNTEIIYSSVIDADGNFTIEVEPFDVDTVITIQVIQVLEDPIEEEENTLDELIMPIILDETSVSVLENLPETEEEILEEGAIEAEEDEIIEEEIAESEKETEEEKIEEVVETEEEVQSEAVLPEKKAAEKSESKAAALTVQTTSKKPLGKQYHYVRNGESLKSIAEAYKTTVNQLAKWNDIKNVNIISVGQLISIDGYNNYKNIDKETRVFKNTDEFLSYLVPHAKKAAADNNIYTSVMLAQAIHESAHGKSALATSGNNLFGIKGSYEGNTINMLTWEVIDGKDIWIVDGFRLYPSFYESLLDNADKIRNGLTWNNAFYNGAWVENTASHMDATEWLTGRYATDPAYASKLNNTISFYNLTQYDSHVKITNPIINQQNINRSATLTGKNYSIFEQPKGAANGNLRFSSNDFLNKEVIINKEKVNNIGTWWHISVDGNNLGYILKDSLSNVNYIVTNSKPVSYTAEITQDWSVNDKPFGTKGSKKITSGKTYFGQTLNVVEEAVTDKATYVLLEKNGKRIGWIDAGAIKVNKEILSTEETRYAAYISEPWEILTEPRNSGKAKVIADYRSYQGTVVEVTEESVTKGDKAGSANIVNARISLNGKFLGWINRGALERYAVLSTKNTNYFAVIEKPWSINTQPWGIPGYKQIPNSSSYVNKGVTVVQEKTTQCGTYALIKLDGVTLGWIDKSALTENLEVISTKNVNYAANTNTAAVIYSKPWGVSGFKEVGSTNTYLNSTVTVDQEQTTARNTYSRISINGKTLGWVEKDRLDILKVSKTTSVSYDARVVNAWSINTHPWGTNGYSEVNDGSSFAGKNVQVVEEKVTQRSTYALIQRNGKSIGWIDKGALSAYNNVLSSRDTQYAAKITKAWSINSKPWGTLGAKEAVRNSYVNKVVEVIREQTTEKSTYALISLNGQELGWIDVTGIEKHQIISSEQTNYDATIAKAWSINTQPWGIEGYKFVDDGSGYLGKNVTVVEEAVTNRSTYALLQIDGKSIGWIDKGALESYIKVLSTKNINYMAEVTKPWSINTQPWGTVGSKEVVTNTLVGKVVEVIQEKTTEKSTYALIVVDGEEIGWIDKTGIDQYRSLYRRDTHYLATITKPWSINTAPWGTAGAKLIESDSSYVGQDFLVTEERVTQKGIYGKLETSSGVLGWIDVTGISAYTVTNTRNVSYKAQIVKPWSINTQPWGTLQYEPIKNADSYLWSHVEIVQEKTTRKAKYGLIKYYGEYIGWIDLGAIR